MRVAAGTSGFSYKEWQGSFYPEKLAASKMLEFYAERLPSVELNNTFYRMPQEKLIRGWQERAPASFRFALKAPRLCHFSGWWPPALAARQPSRFVLRGRPERAPRPRKST